MNYTIQEHKLLYKHKNNLLKKKRRKDYFDFSLRKVQAIRLAWTLVSEK